MGEVLTSVTILICMIMILRRLTKGKIGMGFRYALWLVVALRLVVPVSFGHSSLSFMNLMPEWLYGGWSTAESVVEGIRPDQPESGQMTDMEESTDGMTSRTAYDTAADKATDTEGAEAVAAGGVSMGNLPEDEKNHRADPFSSDTAEDVIATEKAGISGVSNIPVSWPEWIGSRQIRFTMIMIWAAGIAIVGGYMLVSQIRFVRYLHHMRRQIAMENMPEAWRIRLEERRMHVYLIAGLPSPCLVGRDIYIESHIWEEKDELQHILAHEYAHSLHADSLWAVLRSVLCAIYWFYPLVWLAAYEAKKDCELACDERAVMILGESERFAYGRTLLALLSGREERIRYAGAVLIMGGRENSVKERITMIAGGNKSSKATMVLVMMVTALVCGCAFTGAQTAEGDSDRKAKEIILTNPGIFFADNTDPTGNTDGLELLPEETELLSEKQDRKEDWDPQFGMEEWIEGARQQIEYREQQIEYRRQREESARDAEDVEAYGAEGAVIREILYRADDSVLASAEPVDLAEYYDYLFENGQFPMEDGVWYQLPQEGADGIEFYGLYTQDYGFRGVKIRIGENVNTFDLPWLPVSFKIGVQVLEESEADGMPRSFAFKTCIANNSSSEIWRLYVADRYDTGTIELYHFESEDYRNQLKNQKIELDIDKENSKVNLIGGGNELLGAIDISDYADEKVEEAVWDDGSVGFIFDETKEDQITLHLSIGLKVEGSERMLYQGLPLIGCPVEIGTFGNREFTLGKPYVDENYFSGKRNV